LECCAALIRYVEVSDQILFLPNSIHLTVEGSEKITKIGSDTSRYLELVFNKRNLKSSNNLFGVLNYTVTRNGMRMLKSNILQPSCGIYLPLIGHIDSKS